jgi:hypothetical protein
VEPTGPDPACTLDVSTVELPASLPISAHDREIRSDFAILAFHKIALHMQIRAFFHSSRLRIFDVFFSDVHVGETFFGMSISAERRVTSQHPPVARPWHSCLQSVPGHMRCDWGHSQNGWFSCHVWVWDLISLMNIGIDR